MLQVVGGSRPSYRRLVEVEDPDRFVGMLRARLLKEQIDISASTHWVTERQREDAQAEQLRALKVRLYEVGVTEYPETEAELTEIICRSG